MDTTPIEQWIEALRSDRYIQTASALHTPEGMCCLGVASDIAPFGQWSEELVVEGYEFCYSYSEYADDHYVSDVDLIGPVSDWLGLGDQPTSIPWAVINRLHPEIQDMARPYDTEHDFVDLAALNDCGASFHQIADLIEACWVRGETE